MQGPLANLCTGTTLWTNEHAPSRVTCSGALAAYIQLSSKTAVFSYVAESPTVSARAAGATAAAVQQRRCRDASDTARTPGTCAAAECGMACGSKESSSEHAHGVTRRGPRTCEVCTWGETHH
eukprot:354254-Chlamydomonas_euryale.AAC.7